MLILLLIFRFDPALEYNKSIEGFEMHYKPTFEDIFRIILQVSRFLKEFSDFETESTPLFRHPPIMGSKELEDIGLMVEIKAVNMFTYPDLRKTHAILSNIEGVNIAKEASRDDFRMYFIEKMKQKKASEQMFGSKDVEDNQIQTFDKISNINNFKTLNVITNAMILDDKKNPDSDTSDSEHSKYDNNDMVEYRRKREFFLKEGYESKELNSTMNVNNKNNVSLIENNSIDNNNNKGLIPCFYYYKRWLWMIFPWACLSQNRKCNFSEQIIKSYSSATRYISVLEENKYTKRALKIALEAKLKKKMIYGRKEEIEEEMNTLRNMTKEMILLEQMNRHGKFENSIDYEPLKRKPKKNIVKLDPLNDMSTISKDLNKGKSISSNIQKANTNFFLTQGQADPFQKPAMSTLSKLGRSKMSFMKEKYSTYNEGNHLLSGLSIEEKSLRILPKLKDSISNHNKGALNVLAEEIKQLKNDYNGLLFSNKMLEKKLKEMKYVESNNNLFGTEKEDFNVELLKSKVQNLDEKFRSNMDYFEETQKQKERINTILTICKRNKMQNEEYIRSLNYLLTNFKKCIRKEHDSITKNKMKTKSIQQIVESLVGLIGDNLVNHSKLVSQIKNDLTCKLKFDMSFADGKI